MIFILSVNAASPIKTHIYNRFYRRDRTKEGKIGHTGLGLAIAKRILEIHNRTIIIKSKIGSATTFTFFLPAYHPA
jgi:signal transduction histidine kinase